MGLGGGGLRIAPVLGEPCKYEVTGRVEGTEEPAHSFYFHPPPNPPPPNLCVLEKRDLSKVTRRCQEQILEPSALQMAMLSLKLEAWDLPLALGRNPNL